MKLIINNNSIEIKVAKTFNEKLMGFMFKKNFTYGMLFPNVNSIHTFFMKENIDVIGLNENNIVIYKYVDVHKNMTIFIKNPIKKTSILELPAHTSSNIKIGDKLTFVSE